MGTIENISMREIDRYAKSSEYLVIDVRNMSDYRAFHIDGAISVPYDYIVKGETELPRDRTIVLYCEHGGVSIMAAKYLMKKGYKVVNTIGGMAAYDRLKNKTK